MGGSSARVACAAWDGPPGTAEAATDCLTLTAPEKLAETLHHVVHGYGDEDVTRLLADRFRSAWQRPLALHLLQAPLSFGRFREIARLL